jgi:drug/metabolite transporter (DMT)-like permease
MIYLVIVSIVWAFSFGLIGNRLGGLPPAWLAWIRLGISAVVFLPFVRRLPWRTALVLFAIGMVQFGFMYLAYMTSYRYLQSHEVALFTVTTPLFVAALYDLHGKIFHPRNLIAALLAVCGAGVLLWKGLSSSAPLLGLVLVQASNLCFAAGQLAYRGLMNRMETPLQDQHVFFWLHLGGFAALTPIALPIALAETPPAPTPTQLAILVYLGLVASGLCFFLWNRGSRRVSAGVLAVMNNLKIPLGVAVSLLIFRESAGWATLLAGSLLIAVALLPVRKNRSA